MKKTYLKPSQKVIELHHASAILIGSQYAKGYSGEFGAREYNNNIWDEEW